MQRYSLENFLSEETMELGEKFCIQLDLSVPRQQVLSPMSLYPELPEPEVEAPVVDKWGEVQDSTGDGGNLARRH